MKLYRRYIEPAVQAALADTPVVCVLGPRQAGKTTLVQQLTPKRDYLSFDNPSLLHAALNDPKGFIHGLPESVILDEIQRAPELLLSIKLSVDENRKPGRFILTGSANLMLLPQVQDSLAGRIEVIRLHPLSELEKQGGQFNLLQSFLHGEIRTQLRPGGGVAQGIAEAICTGGYPEPNTRTTAAAKRWFAQYLEAVIHRDARDIGGIQKADELLRMIALLSYRTATLLNTSNIANELKLDRATVEKYLTILERLFLIRRLPAWHKNNAQRLIKTTKVHLVDSGLAASLNRLSVEDWNSHSTDFGGLLESFVVQQLICQASFTDELLRFSHYRDKEKIEVDLVIEQGRNVWGVEVKKSATIRGEDGKGLARLAALAGKQFKGGMLLYNGHDTLPLGTENCFAVPLERLWTP